MAEYDDRNRADYEAITKRLGAALEKLEVDSNLPATEKALAKMARCSRGTLRARIWPLERLREIKRKRKDAVEKSSAQRRRLSDEARLSAERHVDEKRSLTEELARADAETAEWVERFQVVALEVKRLQHQNMVLADAKKELERENQKLRAEKADLAAILFEMQNPVKGSRSREKVVQIGAGRSARKK